MKVNVRPATLPQSRIVLKGTTTDGQRIVVRPAIAVESGGAGGTGSSEIYGVPVVIVGTPNASCTGLGLLNGLDEVFMTLPYTGLTGLVVFEVGGPHVAYTVTATGSWTPVTVTGGTVLRSIITGAVYRGTNTAGPNDGIDADATATSIIREAPIGLQEADINFPPPNAPSIALVFKEDEPFINDDLEIIVETAQGYTLQGDDIIVQRGSVADGKSGFWRIPAGSGSVLGRVVTRPTHVQGVDASDLTHNRIAKAAEGTRGQRLVAVRQTGTAGTDEFARRDVIEFSWLAPDDVTSPDNSVDITRYWQKDEHGRIELSVANYVSTHATPLSDDNPETLGTTYPGVSAAASRSDHAHEFPETAIDTMISTALGGYQPLNAGLTSISALTTAPYGRSLLTLADRAALILAIALTDSDIPNLAASKITSGILAAARLGSGSPSSSNWLRGDGAWSTLPSSVPTHLLAYATDTYLLASQGFGVGHTPTANGSVYTSGGMMRYYPLIVPATMSIKALALWITTGNSGASAVWRAGLYADNGSGLPGSVLIDAGTASLNTTGLKELSFTAVPLTAGDRIWICSGFQGLDTGSTNPAYSAVSTTTTAVAETAPQAPPYMFGYYEKTGVTGALGANPGPAIVRNIVNSCPHLWLKVA